MNSPIRPVTRPHWILLALPGLIVALVHGPTLSNFLYTHDGWNDVQLGENILDGQLPLHENLLRIIPTLSFALRALFGLEMWAWHLPNVLLHMLNTYLVAWLTLQLSQRYRSAGVAAILFASAPLLSHPVEWIGGGYDLFATAGVLLAVSGTLTKKHWLTVGGTLLALLSKEVGVVTAGVAFCTLAATQGLPTTRRQCVDYLRRLGPIVMVTVIIAGLRIAQATLTDDPFAGRSIEPDVGKWLAACPAALGFAGVGALADLLGQQEPTGLDGVGFALFAAIICSIAIARHWTTTGWLLIAAAGSLVPVSLINLGLEDMLQNPRYVYLATALMTPVLPLALGTTHPLSRVILASLIAISVWTGLDRTLKSREVTAAVKPVAELVLGAPDGSRVWVYSGFYDEPTARFLMSQWLMTRRGIRAGYVMRGQDTVFVRLGDAQSDAAQAYFTPLSLRVRPGENDVRILQVFGLQKTAEALPNGPSTVSTQAQNGRWEQIESDWTPIQPIDPNDPLPSVAGATFTSPHFLGPVASAELHPSAAITVPGHMTGIELTLTVRSDASIRYASGYHESYGAIFLGPEWSPRYAMSFALRTDTTEQQVVRLQWDETDRFPEQPQQLGLLPLNYPGTVHIEKVQIRR